MRETSQLIVSAQLTVYHVPSAVGYGSGSIEGSRAVGTAALVSGRKPTGTSFPVFIVAEA